MSNNNDDEGYKIVEDENAVYVLVETRVADGRIEDTSVQVFRNSGGARAAMRQRYNELTSTKGICGSDAPTDADSSCCITWEDDEYVSMRIYKRPIKSALGQVVCVRTDDGTAWKMMNPRTGTTIGHFTFRGDACRDARRRGFEIAAWIED